MDELNNEELMTMLMAGESREGNLNVKEEPEYEKPEFNVSIKEVTKRIGKYEKELISKIKKNPDKFMVETSEGQMTLKEAMERGWNPKSDKFDKEDIVKKKEEALSKLSDSDREAIERLTNPETAQIPAAEAEAMGLDERSPMIRRAPVPLGGDRDGYAPAGDGEEEEEEEEEEPAMNPEMMAMLGGGM